MSNDIEELIEAWNKIYRESFQKRELNESNSIPTEEEIRNAFSAKGNRGKKIVPTIELLYSAYNIIRKDLFNNHLPSSDYDIMFNVRVLPKSSWMGLTECHMIYNGEKLNRLFRLTVSLNSAYQLSLHEWLEIIVHEMIHVYDYSYCKDHFNKRTARHYDIHGKWFLDFGKKFSKYGFHVQQYCTAKLEVDKGNEKMKNAVKKYVFIVLDGWKKWECNERAVIIVSENNVEKTLGFIAARNKIGLYSGLNKFLIYKTDNPNAVSLNTTRMRSASSSISCYRFDKPDFQKDYGPFKLVDKIKLSEVKITEDKDEDDIDTWNQIDDEFARDLYQMNGVVEVEKIDDDTYRVAVE